MSFARGVVVGCLATAGLVTLPKVLEGYGTFLPSAASPPRVESPEEVQAAAEKLKEAEILAYGKPEGGRIKRILGNHILEYDCSHKIPVWVAQHLTASSLKGEADRRFSEFRSDPQIPPMFSAQNADYRGSGWSRGHMAPAGDNKLSQDAMNNTFYLSNILPQDIQNNGGFWNRMEIYCRDLTKSFDDVWVTSGPLFLPTKGEDGKKSVTYQVIGENEVSVPSHLYKVIIAKKNDQLVTGSFVVPNKPIGYSHHLKEFQVPMEYVEKKAGVRFHSSLERSQAENLCEVTGCNMMTKAELDQYIFLRRLRRANNLKKLEKIWKEIQEKEVPINAALTEVYQKYSVEFAKAQTCPVDQKQEPKKSDIACDNSDVKKAASSGG